MKLFHPNNRETGSIVLRLFAVFTLIVMQLAVPIAGLTTAFAAGGDFKTTDFAAAAPFTYDHSTGGGAYNDRTVGDYNDVTEQLEGGQFACSDIVTYLMQIEMEDAVVEANQSVKVEVSFLANSTGQAGAAHSSIESISINYGSVENGDGGTPPGGGVGTFDTDSGIIDDGGSTVNVIQTYLTGPLFQSGSELWAEFTVDDLEAGETVVVRIDTRLACEQGSSPTGNLQGKLETVIALPSGDAAGSGQQTIPFLKIGEIAGAGEPLLDIEKTVMLDGGTCGVDDVESLTVTAGDTVTYCYVVSNPGTTDLFDVEVVDDSGTPGSTSDDFTLIVGTLAGVSSVTLEQDVTLSIGGTVVNTAEASGNNGLSGGNFQILTAADTAEVIVQGQPNRPPNAINDSFSGNEDAVISGNVLAANPTTADSDPDGNLDSNSVTLISGPSNGSLTLNSDGTFTYTPNDNFNGTDSFVYQVCDTEGLCDQATVTLTVNAVNDAPDAVNDSYSTAEDTSLTVPAPGVLNNDTDVDGDSLTVTSNTQPANGSVTQNPDGSFTYTPDPDFNGTDSYTYTISDSNGGTDTATVTITVSPVNDAPDAVNDSATVNEDGSVDIPVLGNDTDVDGDSLTVTAVSDPPNGTATINDDGTVNYEPDPNFCGTDTFTYTISDGNGGTDTATVTVDVVCVNDPPVANNDSGTTPEDTAITIDAAANDTDIDGNLDPSTTTVLTSPTHGTLVNNNDGTFSYTPAPNYNGPDSFTYKICDTGGLCDTSTVDITVTPVQDAPDAVDDSANVDEDGSVDIPVLGNDTDADGDSLTVTEVSDPPNGTATINPDGTVKYTPAPDFCGQDSFTYTISDGNDGTDTATVTVDVACVNDPPDAVNDTASTDEDVPVTIPVLNNDSDPDSDPLTVTTVSDPPNGSVTINPDGTVTYTPDPNYNGEDSFTYTICDPDNACDTATVTITIGALNDPPVANNDSVTTPEDTSVLIDAAANDTDVDGNLDPSTTTVLTSPSHGTLINNGDGTFSYTPDPNYNGPDSFTYEICDTDGLCDMATVNITVSPVNDAPVANDDSYNATEDTPLTVPAPGVLNNDTDVDGDSLTVTSNTQPANGSVTQNADGSFTYTPDANFCGQDSYSYTVSDGNGGTDTATVTIDVACVNDAPVALDDAYSTDEDTVLDVAAPGILVNDSDVDGDSLFVDSNTQPANGTVVANPDGSFTYTPNANFNGVDTFDYTISDGNGGSDTATVTITVNPVNDAPVANGDSYNATEDTPLTIDAPGVLGNDTDVDGDSLTVVSYTQPANGTLVQNADGSFTYTPDANFCGTDSYDYTISDGNGGSDTATVTIDVACVNDAPVALDDADSTDEDTVLNVVAPGILGNDSDVDGDSLTVSAVNGDTANVGQQITLASGALLTVNADGSYSYDPNGQYDYLAVGETAQESFTYAISDGNGGSDTATVTITIVGVNDAPVAVDDAYTGQQDETLTILAPGVLVNDFDVDGDAIFVDSYDATSEFGGSINMNADGSFSYTPAPGFAGYDTFIYTISDGNGGYDTATVTITVEARNNRSISVDWGDWTWDGSTLSGYFFITNQSGGYDVQINDLDFEVQYRLPGGGGWTYVQVVEGSCSFSPETNFLVVDQQQVDFSGCELAEDIPDGATVRVTAKVKIFGRFMGKRKADGWFLSRLSK